MKKQLESAIDGLWALWHQTDEQQIMDKIISAICKLEDAIKICGDE